MPAPPAAANLAEMAGRLGVATVPAVWPAGLAHMGMVVSTCENCDASGVCGDWLARAPKRLDHVPPFCANAGALRTARNVRG